MGFGLGWGVVCFFPVGWFWEGCFALACFVYAQLCELSELCVNLKGNRDGLTNVNIFVWRSKNIGGKDSQKSYNLRKGE